MTREQEMAQLLIEDFMREQVPTERLITIRGEGGRADNTSQASSPARPSTYSLQNDEARLRALQTYSGCEDE